LRPVLLASLGRLRGSNAVIVILNHFLRCCLR
jgi:hypothetical protein